MLRSVFSLLVARAHARGNISLGKCCICLTASTVNTETRLCDIFTIFFFFFFFLTKHCPQIIIIRGQIKLKRLRTNDENRCKLSKATGFLSHPWRCWSSKRFIFDIWPIGRNSVSKRILTNFPVELYEQVDTDKTTSVSPQIALFL